MVREPEPGKRVHLNLGVPQDLKRKIAKEAKRRGWSISAETVHRLAASFEVEPLVDQVTQRVAKIRVIHSDPDQVGARLDRLNEKIHALIGQVAELTAKLAEKESK